MTKHSSKLLRRAPRAGASGAQISPNRYDALRKAILAVTPKDPDGVALPELVRAVAVRVPRDLFRGASLRWYTTAVKLDLEAEGLIERKPGSRPQRVRRVQKNRPSRPGRSPEVRRSHAQRKARATVLD